MPVNPSIDYLNTKEDQNVSCWQCDHFQRYDRDEGQATFNAGECRFAAPLVDKTDAYQKDKIYYAELKWRLLMNGRDYWCAKFQRSRETNIPEPADGYSLANPSYWDSFHQGPWNKKIKTGYVANPEEGICCWNCDHFEPFAQRNGEIVYSNAGQCRFSPEYPYLRGTFDAGYLWEWNTFPYLWKATCYWCSKWERTTRNLGPAPAGGAGPSNPYECPAAPAAEATVELTTAFLRTDPSAATVKAAAALAEATEAPAKTTKKK